MNQNRTPPPESDRRDRRERRERRSQALPFWHLGRLRGRRGINRRAEQHNALYFVERIPASAFFLSVFLLVCTIADGLITFVLLDYGFEEANPLMRLLLDADPHYFFAAKFALTAVFLPVALVMHRYRLFNTRFRVGHLLPIVSILYAILLLHQLSLWNQRDQPFPGMSGRHPRTDP